MSLLNAEGCCGIFFVWVDEDPSDSKTILLIFYNSLKTQFVIDDMLIEWQDWLFSIVPCHEGHR